ncbi:hypothetical protein OROGR_029461 [Orobanche gracilis]
MDSITGEPGASNGGMLYHEVQESKLCAVHCVNTVLQGPFFSEFDLAALASDLDRTERQMMLGSVTGDFLPEVSHNVSLDGDFSIQKLGSRKYSGLTALPYVVRISGELGKHNHVLQKALEVWNLHIIPLDSPVAEPAQIDPEKENAFICHLQDHWFCIRKVNGEWYNFDSLYAAPEHLSKFYLSAYLDSLKGFGWSIFLVRGDYPKDCPITSSDDPNGYGQWLLPEDAERIIKSCNSASRMGGGRLQPSNPGALFLNDEDDEDFKAAIAASLVDSSSPTVASQPGNSGNEQESSKVKNE